MDMRCGSISDTKRPHAVRGRLFAESILRLGSILLLYSQFSCFTSVDATELCPNPSSLGASADPDHWIYSKGQGEKDGINFPCNSCDDPENAESPKCRVYRFLRSEDCRAGDCRDDQGTFRLNFKDQLATQYDTRYLTPDVYPKAQGENCRILIWALQPVTGLEDTNRRGDYPFWYDAWNISQKLVRPAFKKSSVGFITQPYRVRGQHQLHIHIGKLLPEYRTGLDSLRQDPTTIQSLTINGEVLYAKYVLNARPGYPFTGQNPFDVARSIIPGGASEAPDYGILTAVSRDMKGIFVLVGKSLERDQLDYKSDKACRVLGMHSP